MGLAVTRLRDVGNVTIDGDPLGCAQSATITLDSEVLRARCGFAISERYQGITGLSLEAVIETLNPFADFHPGDFGILVVEIPSADPASGLPGLPDKLTMEGVITNVVRRFVRNELSTGTYTFRGISSDGIECPILYEPSAGGGVISLGEPEDFIRDIRTFTFAGCITTEEFCAESVEITEATELIEDSCQGQLWPTYVGITGLNVTVTATGKGIFHAFDCAAGAVPGFSTCLGSKGIIEIGVDSGQERQRHLAHHHGHPRRDRYDQPDVDGARRGGRGAGSGAQGHRRDHRSLAVTFSSGGSDGAALVRPPLCLYTRDQ
jgi:hypothetical protein